MLRCPNASVAAINICTAIPSDTLALSSAANNLGVIKILRPRFRSDTSFEVVFFHSYSARLLVYC